MTRLCVFLEADRPRPHKRKLRFSGIEERGEGKSHGRDKRDRNCSTGRS